MKVNQCNNNNFTTYFIKRYKKIFCKHISYEGFNRTIKCHKEILIL